VVVLVIASLMINHTVAMPSPADEDVLTSGVNALVAQRRGRAVVHVIYKDCSCTSGLLDHLDQRGPLDDASEIILFVGEDPSREAQLTSRGFLWYTTDEARLEQELALVSAPVLIVMDNETLRYAGGYYRLPAAVKPLDREIFAQLDDDEAPKSLPVFGCAVNAELRAQLDPFGLQR